MARQKHADISDLSRQVGPSQITCLDGNFSKGGSMPVVEVKVKGVLKEEWGQWFSGMQVHALESGETLLCGTVQDQAAFYGLIASLRDLGLQLVSVNSQELDRGE